MDIRNWCSSGNRSSRSIIKLGRHDHHHDRSSSSTVTSGPCKMRYYWKVLWMRLKKKGIIVCEPVHHHHPVGGDDPRCGTGLYDPCSYSRNFDHGFAWDDHDAEPDHDDNLSRSFSFRFSDPSNCNNIFVDLNMGQNSNCATNVGVVRKELCV